MKRLGPLILVALSLALPSFAVPSPKCEIDLGSENLSLNAPIKGTENLDAAFALLEHLEISQGIARAGQDKLKSGKLKIELLTSKATSSPVPEPAGLFEAGKEESKIELRSSELGLLAVHLYHELVHAADLDFEKSAMSLLEQRKAHDALGKFVNFPSLEWVTWEEESSRIQKDRQLMVFKAERLAFNGQRALLLELMKQTPCASGFYRFHERQKHIIVAEVPDTTLRSLYNLYRLPN